jgi:2-polyprenyl-3-methyl-5-hydroxy-6-metoxy-1,4-benzoquinol methylase
VNKAPKNCSRELVAGQRFEFGRNWKRFLKTVDDDRIRRAEQSLQRMLNRKELRGVCFLDVGSGSGLFSLAARRLGAVVHSFDYDPRSVECTRELKRRYFPSEEEWTVEEGSVLDKQYLRTLGLFDVVYAWGVLHHTNAMWEALDNVSALVSRGGRLFVAIYNDQGLKSKLWRKVKKAYCSGWLGKASVCSVFVPVFAIGELLNDLLNGRNPFRSFNIKSRGMSRTHDWLDWLGGYPYEVAKPEEVVEFCRKRGFSLEKLATAGNRLGNNQYVFVLNDTA